MTVNPDTAVISKKVEEIAQYDKLMNMEKADLANKIISLQKQLNNLKYAAFGNASRSEKAIPGLDGQLEFDFFTEEEKKAAQEALAKVEAEEAERMSATKDNKESKKGLPRRTRKATDIETSGLPVVTVIVEPEGINDENRDQYVTIGQEVTRQLVIEPRKIMIRETVRKKMVLKSSLQYADPDRQAFEIAPAPVDVFPKCMASASMLTDIVVQKYLYHIPFHRVIRQYGEYGLGINSSTINDWFNRTCDLTRPLYNELRKKILRSPYNHCDETYAKMYSPEKRKVWTGYLWAICEGNGGNAIFMYERGSKDAKASKSIWGLYNGAIQTDCNSIYNKYDKNPYITTIGCWVHCRRYWIKAMAEDRKTASQAVALINKLYTVEHDAILCKASYEERLKMRQERSLPILDLFTQWLSHLDTSIYSDKSPMRDAIYYTIKHFPKLSRYVTDGRYNIDNNKIEALIRPIKIGLKNYQYFRGDDSAYRSAIMYSFIATCDGNDVNVREWMEDILPKLARIDYDSESGKEQVAALLPDEWKKSHKDSHSLIKHMTEEEHIKQILSEREKRNAVKELAEQENAQA